MLKKILYPKKSHNEESSYDNLSIESVISSIFLHQH